jgi:putative DNA primase/helicase
MWDRYVRYLRESLDPESAGFIQEYLGYCLTAETDEEKMLFLVGPRGSGKSTLIEGVEAMLGPDLSTTRSLDGLQERFGRVGIVGKRVIVSKEMKALKLLETDLVSSIVSGEKIPIEHKGRDSFDYRPVAKVIQAANNLPRVPNTEAGIYRRLQVVQFPHLPESERDKGVKEGIRQEGPRVLNWALDGLARLRERGGLEVSERVRRASKEWYNDNDTVGMFFAECLEEGTKKIPATRIHDLYTLWSKQRGYGTLAATPFFVRANALGFYKQHLKKPKNIKTLCDVDLTDEGHKINESGYRPAIDYASL